MLRFSLRTRVALASASVIVSASIAMLAIAITMAPGVAIAQTVATTATATATTTTGASVSQSPNQVDPNRYVNNKPLGQSTRPLNLTPTGISYSDCASDMVLQFPVVLNNFNGSEVLEVWAGASGTDCSQDTNRGIGGLLPVCWQVTQAVAGIVAVGQPNAQNISIRVQDIVSHIGTTVSTSAYTPSGIAACSSQVVDTAAMIGIFFVPTFSTGQVDGNVYEYPLTVDLVGPAAPVAPTVAGAGDTLLLASWTPNIDPDTIGYDIYIDPIPGEESESFVGSEPVLVCFDSGGGGASKVADATVAGDGAITDGALADGASTDAESTDAESIGDGDDDAGDLDAATPATPDAQCVFETRASVPSTGTGGVCASSVLNNGASTVLDGSAAATTTTTTTNDEASVLEDDASEVLVEDGGLVSSAGGISHIDPRYLYKPDQTTGITAASQTAASLTITGLKDNIQYNIAIAAVDALGNVGPLSNLQCGTPAPVDDFWKIYREAGGQAGGGFCALEGAGAPAGSAVAFGGLMSIAAAAVRRRRRKQR